MKTKPFFFIIFSLFLWFSVEISAQRVVLLNKKINLSIDKKFELINIPPEHEDYAQQLQVRFYNWMKHDLDSLQKVFDYNFVANNISSDLTFKGAIRYGKNDGIKSWKRNRFSFHYFITDNFNGDTLNAQATTTDTIYTFEHLPRNFIRERSYQLISACVSPHTYIFADTLLKEVNTNVSFEQLFDLCRTIKNKELAHIFTELAANALIHQKDKNFKINVYRGYTDKTKYKKDIRIEGKICEKDNKFYELKLAFNGKNIISDAFGTSTKLNFLFDKKRVDNGDFVEVLHGLNGTMLSFLVKNFL